MSDEVGDYYRDSLTLYALSQYDDYVLGQQPAASMSWFFGFPYAFPVTRLRFYGWGNLIVVASPPDGVSKSRAFNGWTSPRYWEPSTEQFYGMAQTRDPIKFTYLDPVSFLGCDEDGRLWCYGFGDISRRTSPPGRSLTRFGLDDDQYPDTAPHSQPGSAVRVFRGWRRVHVPVYGDNGDIASQRFVKTGSALAGRSFENYPVCYALNDQNELWIAGRTLDVFEDGVIQTNETDTPPGDLRFFRKMAITTVYDEHMQQVTLEEPLQIADFWASKSLLLLTIDGDLYVQNGTHPRFFVDRRGFYKVSGFVKSVQMTNGGSNYTSDPTIHVSAPSSQNGSMATFAIRRSGGAIVDIRIVHPGSGYGNSPPAITFTGGGGAGATAICEVFDEKWISASLSLPAENGTIAAISQSGELYTWGFSSLWAEDSAVWRPERLNTQQWGTLYYFNGDTTLVPNPLGGNFAFVGYPFPVRAWNPSGESYAFVSCGQDRSAVCHGVLLSGDGIASYWGSFGFFGVNGTPNLEMAHYPRRLSDATEIGSKRFLQAVAGYRHVVLLDEDGVAYTYGTGGANSSYLGQGYFPAQDGSIKQVIGDAKWTKVFAGYADAVLATRHEDFDADGNRLNPLPPIAAN